MDSMVRSLFELGMPWWEFVLRAITVYAVLLMLFFEWGVALHDMEVENIVSGKRSLVPYLLEDALKEKGADYSKAFIPFSGYAVTDGRLITGENPKSAGDVANAVIAALEKPTP